MFEVGFTEIVLIFGIALLVLGPARLPKLAADLGRWAGRARAMARQLRTQLEQEVQFDPLADTHRRPAAAPTIHAPVPAPVVESPAAAPADPASTSVAVAAVAEPAPSISEPPAAQAASVPRPDSPPPETDGR